METTYEEYRKRCLENKYSKAAYEANKERWERNVRMSYEQHKTVSDLLFKIYDLVDIYNESMNSIKIDKIPYSEIRNIKYKYNSLKHKALRDEYHIKDSELGDVYDKYSKEERKELYNYITSLTEERIDKLIEKPYEN